MWGSALRNVRLDLSKFEPVRLGAGRVTTRRNRQDRDHAHGGPSGLVQGARREPQVDSHRTLGSIRRRNIGAPTFTINPDTAVVTVGPVGVGRTGRPSSGYQPFREPIPSEMRLDRPHWNAPSSEASGDRAPVEVWRLRREDLSAAPMDRVRRLTVPSEWERAERFRQEADRLRHLAGRALLRAAVGDRYGCDPRALSIVEDSNGKPHLEGPVGDASPPEINVAHAADVVLVAISEEHAVGIDVEPLDRELDADLLVDRVFTPSERERWRAQPDAVRRAFFVHVWTCKEAFLKATGRGLRQGAQSVECVFSEATVTGFRDLEGDRAGSVTDWALRVFRASEQVAGAVVRKAPLSNSLLFGEGAPLVRRISRSA